MLYSKKFSNILKNGGCKEIFKLPSYINHIEAIGFFISNPLFSSGTGLSPIHIFNAVVVSLNLFNQNNSIIDLKLNQNEFIIFEDTATLGLAIKSNHYFDINKILVPLNKDNIKNTNTTIVFKESEKLKEMRSDVTYGAIYTDWRPTVEMYIKYL